MAKNKTKDFIFPIQIRMADLFGELINDDLVRRAKQLIAQRKINIPIECEATARLHRVKRTGDINVEVLLRTAGYQTMHWLVVAVMGFDLSSDSFDLMLMKEYEDEFRSFRASGRRLPQGLKKIIVASDLKMNAAIALHRPHVFGRVIGTGEDFEVTTNGVHLDVLKGIIPGHFNVWLGDSHDEEMAIGTIRADLDRIDSVTNVTDEAFALCHRMELLTIFKSIMGSVYETKEDLESNSYKW
jgi:hypothetical protein